MARLVDSTNEQRAAFAEALDVYLHRAKMRPVDLVRALRAAGLNVHQPSMTYWLQGVSEPQRTIVVEMERQLELMPGLLARTLGWLPVDAVAMASADVETAIIADDGLAPEQREVLLTAYRAMIALQVGADRVADRQRAE